MHEKIVQIGQSNVMNGVLAEPEAVTAGSPLVIILNSGLMHHVGTCRFSVKLARTLAEKNIASLRFDFFNVGDSLAIRGREYSQENSVNDIKDVMTAMEQHGYKHFLLYGLCSGGYDSYHTALVDKRVKAIAQIDPYVYRTPAWYWHHYLPRLINVTTWWEMVRDKLPWLDNIPNKKDLIEESALSVIPPKQEVVEGYTRIAAAGINILIIMTGGAAYGLNSEKQLFTMYADVDWQNRLSYHYFPDCSHILSEPKYQLEIKNIIVDWILGQV